MKMKIKVIGIATAALWVNACASTPELQTVDIAAPTFENTCYPVNTLVKVVVPAVTKSGFYVVSIESPPEIYTDDRTGKTTEIPVPTISSRTPYTRIVEEEKIYYTTQNGVRVDNICQADESAAE